MIVINGIDEDCDGLDLLSNTEVLLDVEFKVYPNPSTGEVYIYFSNYRSGIEYKVLDVRGNILAKKSISSNIEYVELENGFYIIEVSDLETMMYKYEKLFVNR